MSQRFSPAPYKCPWWLSNAHWHTICSTLLPRFKPRRGPWQEVAQEVLFTLADGDRLRGILHLHPDDAARRRPLVLLLHGLEGSCEAHYMMGMSYKAFQAGMHSIRLNFRSCGGTEALAHRLYHSGNTADIEEVMHILVERWGFQQILPVGVSFGGNMLLHLLADLGESPPPYVIGATSISAPIDLALSSHALRQGFNRVYEGFFLRSLKRRLRLKVAHSPQGQLLRRLQDRLDHVYSIFDFDDQIIAPHGGYAGATDYYARCSSADLIRRIRLPVLLIHAQDDPFVPFDMYARRLQDWDRSWITTVFPAQGGHVGFLSARAPHNPSWMDGRWAEDQAVAFCQQF